MICHGCGHKGSLVLLLTRKAIEKIDGGNMRWCRNCGCIRHTDTDGSVRWAYTASRKRGYFDHGQTS